VDARSTGVLKVDFMETRHEGDPSRYCECGYPKDGLRIPAERNTHSARHRSYAEGAKLGKTFPFERIAEDNIMCVSGEETGYASRVAYYLARDFKRECGFDFVMWPYMGEQAMGEPGHRANLYVEGGFAVGLLLGQSDVKWLDADGSIPALVRGIYTAGAHRRKGIANILAERFARDVGAAPQALVWDGPLTAAGAAVVRSVGGPEAIVTGGGVP
jgi:hypothetical protein